jgi:hypothetical protein
MLATALNMFAASYAVADSKAKFSPRDLDAYYEKSGVDLTQYNSILLGELGLDNVRVLPPPWIADEDKSPERWQLTESDMQWLRKSYREAMEAEISGNGGYPIVDQLGEGVLILDINMIYLMPYARKGEEVETRGFGTMLVQAQLRDGVTAELLGVYEVKQEVGSEYQQNTRLNNENSLRELFKAWGARMRGIMDSKRLD